ncbi:potassium transporter [Streptomyces albus subsp. albus]|nr:potassium transporter [Streptomyces albus subsp. albus]
MKSLLTPRRRRLRLGAALLLLVVAALPFGTGLWSGGQGQFVLDPVTRFLLVVAVILLVSHLLGMLMKRLGHPLVLGEILGGVALGPSVLGLIWPGAMEWLSAPAVLGDVDKAGQLGLVVFMFLLGCELRTDRIVRPRLVAATVAGGMGLPLVGGASLATSFASFLALHGTVTASYALFFGLALAVTAMPVLARILVDLRLNHTDTGSLAMSAAAIGDGVAWLILTFILAGAGREASTTVAETAYLAMALVAVTLLCLRPALRVLVARISSERLLAAVLLSGAILYSGMTQAINLHPVVGAFLFGVVVPRRSEAVERVGQQLQGFTLIVLLPVFFAGVGLKTSVGLIGAHPLHWLVFTAVLVVAVVSKFVGAGGAARLLGLSWKQSWQLGALMNCRGVTELAIATIGLKAGLINELGFTILVIVAVITTAVTGPMLRRITRNDAVGEVPAREPARPAAI